MNASLGSHKKEPRQHNLARTNITLQHTRPLGASARNQANPNPRLARNLFPAAGAAAAAAARAIWTRARAGSTPGQKRTRRRLCASGSYSPAAACLAFRARERAKMRTEKWLGVVRKLISGPGGFLKRKCASFVFNSTLNLGFDSGIILRPEHLHKLKHDKR